MNNIVTDLRRHSCGEISCEECNDEREAAARDIERLTALVRELRDWIKATIHLSGYSRELVAMQKTIAKSEGI